ncbi:hypothetical protein PBDP_4780 [Pseudomonas sp. St290]|nr:hypothetical protein PBDP_4780 [Pseudomonas sp. St290]
MPGNTLVGASLLAMASGQTHRRWMWCPHREQARSHKESIGPGLAAILGIALPGDKPTFL